MIKARKADTVKVRYTGQLADGTVFDQSPEDRPILFILGQNEVIPGFEEAVEGMYQGETKSFVIPAEKAYGPVDQELIETVDRSLIPEDVELVAGGQLEVTQKDGHVFRIKVLEVGEHDVVLDGNHPLAGEDLTFEIELLEVRKQSAQ